MDGGVSGDANAAWFAARTDGAPPRLRRRAAEFFERAAEGSLAARLSAASRAALDAAAADGVGRAAALDLLAADALITLALLACAEQDPSGLALAARDLRLQATSAV